MNDPLLNHFRDQWHLVRTLTRDLLMFMPEEDLILTPGAGLGPWWKQFRHMGRIQENYLDALTSGKMQFGFAGASYAGDATKQALAQYLDHLDQRLESLINKGLPQKTVDWFGEPKPVVQHLLCLADHELLHHGQWIVYRRLLGGAFPHSWRMWGL